MRYYVIDYACKLSYAPTIVTFGALGAAERPRDVSKLHQEAASGRFQVTPGRLWSNLSSGIMSLTFAQHSVLIPNPNASQ